MEPKTKSLTIPEPDQFKTKELIVKYGGVETETIIWVYEYKRQKLYQKCIIFGQRMNINRGSQLFPHRASCPMWDIAVKYICCLVILVTQNASTRKNKQLYKESYFCLLSIPKRRDFTLIDFIGYIKLFGDISDGIFLQQR